jgi:hypothetical protein
MKKWERSRQFHFFQPGVARNRFVVIRFATSQSSFQSDTLIRYATFKVVAMDQGVR